MIQKANCKNSQQQKRYCSVKHFQEQTKKNQTHLGEEPVHHLRSSSKTMPKLCCLQSTPAALTEYFRTLTFWVTPRSTSGSMVTTTCKLLFIPVRVQVPSTHSISLYHTNLPVAGKSKKKKVLKNELPSHSYRSNLTYTFMIIYITPAELV